MVNIKGLDKADVLFALWLRSHAQGMSFVGLKNFNLDRAKYWIENTTPRLYFDYVDGHVIKCDLSGDEFDERLYDRDCGDGAAAEAIRYIKDDKLNELYESYIRNNNDDTMNRFSDFLRSLVDKKD